MNMVGRLLIATTARIRILSKFAAGTIEMLGAIVEKTLSDLTISQMIARPDVRAFGMTIVVERV
jgi:hypothetical protein